MNKELINALQKLEIDGEVVFNETIEYCAQKIDAFINSHPTETTKVSTNKKAKEVCGTCIRYNTCKKYVMYNDNACIIYDKQTG